MTDIDICEIPTCKEQYLDLLLIGDEQEDMILRYLGRGRLFIGFIGSLPVACCVSTEESGNTIEIRNLAVRADFRHRGIARHMLRHVESQYPGSTFQLGTGETPSTLRFYKKCGYRLSHRIPGFFTDNYDHPIVEEGVTLTDMIYLKKTPADNTRHMPEAIRN